MLGVPISKGLGNHNEIKIVFLLRVSCRGRNRSNDYLKKLPCDTLLHVYFKRVSVLSIWSTDGEGMTFAATTFSLTHGRHSSLIISLYGQRLLVNPQQSG